MTRYLRLETTGRITGLPHIVELRYAWMGGEYFVLSNQRGSDWVRNATRLGSARVRLGEFLVDVGASLVDERRKGEVLSSFEAKYGAREVRRWYSHPEVCLRLTPTGPSIRRGAGGGELDARATFSDWASSKTGYYDDISKAFDSASDEYDFTIRRNFINTWIRRRSLQILRELVRSDDLLLEVGCGTGAEAMVVSEWVSGIIATDVSSRMIELVQAKAAAKQLQQRVVPMTVRARDIGRVRSLAGDRKIRVGYSFNGALNCEPDLDHFVLQLHSLLEPGGYFACSVRNTTCASEMVLHGLALQFSRATPRRTQPTMVSVGGMDIPSTYFSPSQFISHFRPYFTPVQVIGLPALLPPAYLNEYYLKWRNVSSVLERLEPILSRYTPFNRLGDQTLFVFRNSHA